MNTTKDSETTMQLVVLEEMFNEELHCQSPHRVTECSVTVTHLVLSCTPKKVICMNAAEQNKRWVGSNSICRDCELPARDCWRIIPI